MREQVRAEAAAAEQLEDETETERRGYYWNWHVGRISNMIDYVTHAIRADIGITDTATLGSIILLERALLHLQLELQDGGTKEGREDRLENQFRVQQALRALSPGFDDMQLRRLRALQVAFTASRLTAIPDDA